MSMPDDELVSSDASAARNAAAPLGVAAGPAVESISSLLGGPKVDDLPRRAALRAPGRCALRGADGEVSYLMLDEMITRCALALSGLIGRSGVVVGVTAVLDPVFAVAYYGTARSGNTSAIINPLLKADGLEHVLSSCAAEAAIMTPAQWAMLKPIMHRLPRLRHPMLTHAPRVGSAGIPVLADLMARSENIPRAEDSAPHPAGPAEAASILFTSGTTGSPKAVPLTHRNLIVNAAQMIEAHDIDATSVMLVYLPTFHVMHLNGAVSAGASLVVHEGDDVAGSIEAANEHGVTHYYSLPMRLSRLAADPRLPSLALRTTRALLSGGSALPRETAAVLADHFGIPVVQGYGLAETSPLTHMDRMTTPRAGSCGTPVAGTECRVVDVETRLVLRAGQKGEIEVRGPQLMRGYLGQDQTPEINDGWFSTGDIGHVDADGYLFLTDRLKDVFKCDNYLVSPAEIEAVLRRHTAVADCAVVDYPDEFSGAVACALVVRRPHAASLGEIMRFVNQRLPSYMHLHWLQPVTEIPRSRTGKVQRRELRQWIRQLAGEEGSAIDPADDAGPARTRLRDLDGET